MMSRNPHPSPTVLLVEDNAADAKLFQIAINRSNKNVQLVVSPNGQSAIDCLLSWQSIQDGDQPSLVVVDLNMPRMNGRQFLTMVRADERLRELAIIVFSSSASKNDVNDCLRLGANAYVVKPIDFICFSSKLQHILDFWLRTCESPSSFLEGQASSENS